MRVYDKKVLNPDEHVQHLWNRGLLIDDPAKARKAIEAIGYYRLLIYMRNFQNSGSKRFHPGTKFSHIVELYTFDRELRLLIMDAIERIEVALRAAFSTRIGVIKGAHWYLDKECFEGLNGFFEVQRKVIDEAGPGKRHKWIALNHYYDEYDKPDLPPVWVVLEKLTFGSLSQMFGSLKIGNRKAVAKAFQIDQILLKSWLHSLNAIRNQCAHHGQLWNTQLPFEPSPLDTAPTDFAEPKKLYCRLVVLHLILKQVLPGNDWAARLQTLVSGCPHLTLSSLGFPAHWETRAVWQ